MTETKLMMPVSPSQLTHAQLQRAVAALLGAAIGDALGAPFEFGPAGKYLEAFPEPVLTGTGEMTGGGAFDWAPGEFTDDTQMAVALAESLVACACGFDPAHTFLRFQAWAKSATDIGSTTRRALRGKDWRTAAQLGHEAIGQSAGNGSVMRIAPVGIAGVAWGAQETIRVAFEQSRLTHWEDGAGVGAAIAAELIRRTILTGKCEEHIDDILLLLSEYPFLSADEIAVYGAMLAADWNPFDFDGPTNGSVWTCLAQAVWAVRHTNSFADAVIAAIELGGDADTVAAVTGALAGALYGLQQLPTRWATYVNGSITRPDGTVHTYNNVQLHDLARNLLGLGDCRRTPPERAEGPKLVDPLGVHAANLDGAARAPLNCGVVSMCVTDKRFAHHPLRREVYMRDNEGRVNSALSYAVREAVEAIEAFLSEGAPVVVHCHGGRSRTGIVLKAWHMLRHGSSAAEAHEWLSAEWFLYEPYNQTFNRFLENEWPLVVVEMNKKAGGK